MRISGVKARYMIPAFNPFAGFSPICWAVLVQIEHWALTGEYKKRLLIRSDKIKILNPLCLMVQIYILQPESMILVVNIHVYSGFMYRKITKILYAIPP